MTPITSGAHFRLAALLITSATLAACSSSDSGSSAPRDDQSVGAPAAMDGSGSSTDNDAGGDAGGGAGDGGSGADAPVQMPDPAVSPPGEGSGPMGMGVSGQVTNVGVVLISQEPDDPEDGTVIGTFFRTNLPLPAGQIASQFVPPLDTCQISRSDDTDTVVPGMGAPDFDFTLLNAGDVLVLSSPAGTWLTLPRSEQFGFIIYMPENEGLPLPVPSNLVLDVPGADFPAFSNVAVPDVTPLTGVVTDGSSTFRWNAGAGDPSVFVTIDVIDFTGGANFTSVNCFARDDGEFTLPADIQAELGADFSGFPELDRVGANLVQQGNSLLFVSSTSSGTSGP